MRMKPRKSFDTESSQPPTLSLHKTFGIRSHPSTATGLISSMKHLQQRSAVRSAGGGGHPEPLQLMTRDPARDRPLLRPGQALCGGAGLSDASQLSKVSTSNASIFFLTKLYNPQNSYLALAIAFPPNIRYAPEMSRVI